MRYVVLYFNIGGKGFSAGARSEGFETDQEIKKFAESWAHRYRQENDWIDAQYLRFVEISKEQYAVLEEFATVI